MIRKKTMIFLPVLLLSGVLGACSNRGGDFGTADQSSTVALSDRHWAKIETQGLEMKCFESKIEISGICGFEDVDSLCIELTGIDTSTNTVLFSKTCQSAAASVMCENHRFSAVLPRTGSHGHSVRVQAILKAQDASGLWQEKLRSASVVYEVAAACSQ